MVRPQHWHCSSVRSGPPPSGGSPKASRILGSLPAGVGEAVAAGAGLDDVAAEGEAVDDGGAEAGVGEGFGPAAEAVVAGDRDGGLLLAFGEDLEQQLGAAPVEFHVAEFVEAEQVDAAVAGDGAGELAFVGGFDEFVDELGGEDVADPVAGLGGGGPEPDEQVALAGAAVADQAQRLAFGDPAAAGQGVDRRRVDRGVGGEVEVGQRLGSGEAGFVDAAGGAALLAVVALGEQQLGQERPVGQLLAAGGVGDLAVAVPQRRQPQQPGGAVDRGVDRLLAGRPAGAFDARAVLVVGLVMRSSFR